MQVEKYSLEIIGTQVLAIPAKAKLLDIQTINNRPWLLALVDPKANLVDRTINIVETGEPIKTGGKYIGSFIQTGGGTFVYVSFDEGEK